MSTRFEGFEAGHTRVEAASAGAEIGLDRVPDDQVALLIHGDETAYITGTKADLIDLLTSALAKVGAARTLPEVATGFSEVDGLPIVQIDTVEGEGPIRVCLNDGVLFSGDPEQPAFMELVKKWRQASTELEVHGEADSTQDVEHGAMSNTYAECADALARLIKEPL